MTEETTPTVTDVEPAERGELRDTLMAAARTLLSRGARYPEISVQTLCDEAGVSRWRFYKHFRDKHDLLHSWFENLNRTFAQTHDAWLRLDGVPTPEQFRDAVGELLLPYVPDAALHAAMYDSAAADPIIRAEVDATENARAAELREHIERGQAGGWIDRELLATETAEWIIMTGSRGHQRMVVSSGAMTTHQFVEHFAKFAWHVLYAPGQAPGAEPG